MKVKEKESESEGKRKEDTARKERFFCTNIHSDIAWGTLRSARSIEEAWIRRMIDTTGSMPCF